MVFDLSFGETSSGKQCRYRERERGSPRERRRERERESERESERARAREGQSERERERERERWPGEQAGGQPASTLSFGETSSDKQCRYLLLLFFFFFFTLVTGPRRSLSLKLSNTSVYEPQKRARLGSERLRLASSAGTFFFSKRFKDFYLNAKVRIWH